MTGKKYTAAENHFIKKQEHYDKQILGLQQSLAATRHKIAELLTENQELRSSNELLKDWNERLLEYMDVTDEDRERILKKDKELSQLYFLVKGLGLL